jgi:hypothetical protein
MMPARQAAQVLGLNRKTVQRHYRLLRVEIGGRKVEGQGNVCKDSVSGSEQPLVALVINGSNILVIPFPADDAYAPPCALVSHDFMVFGRRRVERSAALDFRGRKGEHEGRCPGEILGICWAVGENVPGQVPSGAAAIFAGGRLSL